MRLKGYIKKKFIIKAMAVIAIFIAGMIFWMYLMSIGIEYNLFG